jgi:hypothetical protein
MISRSVQSNIGQESSDTVSKLRASKPRNVPDEPSPDRSRPLRFAITSNPRLTAHCIDCMTNGQTDRKRIFVKLKNLLPPRRICRPGRRFEAGSRPGGANEATAIRIRTLKEQSGAVWLEGLGQSAVAAFEGWKSGCDRVRGDRIRRIDDHSCTERFEGVQP